MSALWIIVIVIVLLWLLGLFAFPLGGLINLLWIVVIILVIVWLLQRGRRK